MIENRLQIYKKNRTQQAFVCNFLCFIHFYYHQQASLAAEEQHDDLGSEDAQEH